MKKETEERIKKLDYSQFMDFVHKLKLQPSSCIGYKMPEFLTVINCVDENEVEKALGEVKG